MNTAYLSLQVLGSMKIKTSYKSLSLNDQVRHWRSYIVFETGTIRYYSSTIETLGTYQATHLACIGTVYAVSGQGEELDWTTRSE